VDESAAAPKKKPKYRLTKENSTTRWGFSFTKNSIRSRLFKMPENPELFAVYRPVLSIGEDHVSEVRTRLAELGIYREKDIVDVTKPLENPKVNIISHLEMQRLQKRFEPLLDDNLDELKNQIGAVLMPRAVQFVEVRTMPTLLVTARSQKPGRPANRYLTVGRSNKLEVERSIAQRALKSSLKPAKIPDGFWGGSLASATRIQIARSDNNKKDNILSQFDHLLHRDSLLPHFIRLGPIRMD
jgi:hypothetical protein